MTLTVGCCNLLPIAELGIVAAIMADAPVPLWLMMRTTLRKKNMSYECFDLTVAEGIALFVLIVPIRRTL